MRARARLRNQLTMAETILVVEDEPAIRELIGFACESSGYAVLRAGSVKEASDLLSQNRVHLILLDWMLPDLSGLQWLDKLKRDERYAAVPVIMLTARGTESDKVAGLDAGADDYVVKPFSPRELIARMRAVLRRGGTEAEKTVTCGPLTINEARFSANYTPVSIFEMAVNYAVSKFGSSGGVLLNLCTPYAGFFVGFDAPFTKFEPAYHIPVKRFGMQLNVGINIHFGKKNEG